MAKTKRPATPSPLERAERAVVRAAMGWRRKWLDPVKGYDDKKTLLYACDRLDEERRKARRAGR